MNPRIVKIQDLTALLDLGCNFTDISVSPDGESLEMMKHGPFGVVCVTARFSIQTLDGPRVRSAA